MIGLQAEVFPMLYILCLNVTEMKHDIPADVGTSVLTSKSSIFFCTGYRLLHGRGAFHAFLLAYDAYNNMNTKHTS